jgi:eukaryotic-like serine/threonine-protein kinase
MLSTRGYLRRSGFLLSLSLLILPALASCSVPWNTSSAVVPTPTPQFAGGEPVLPQLQKLYRDAPLPAGGITGSDQSWPLAGHDPANTSAAVAPALRGVMRWFFQTPGPVLASPVAAAGLVLLNGGDGVFYAVDGATGSLKWRAPVGDTLVAGTAAVSDGVIYVAAQGHGLMALSLSTGLPLWTVDTSLPVRAAPLVDGALLFVLAGANDLLCLDRRTGTEYWEFKSEDVLANFWPSQGQPAITTGDGGLVFVALGASTEFNALRLRTGRKAWEQTVDSRMVGSPVYDAQAGLVFAATWSGHIYAMDIHTGTVRWRFSLPQAGVPGAGLAAGPALANGTLFIGDYAGQLIALDASTGKPRWIYQGQGAVVAAPVVRLVNGTAEDVYVTGEDGSLIALNGASGLQEWHIYLGELRSAPALAQGELLIGSVGAHGLFAIN